MVVKKYTNIYIYIYIYIYIVNSFCSACKNFIFILCLIFFGISTIKETLFGTILCIVAVLYLLKTTNSNECISYRGAIAFGMVLVGTSLIVIAISGLPVALTARRIQEFVLFFERGTYFFDFRMYFF